MRIKLVTKYCKSKIGLWHCTQRLDTASFWYSSRFIARQLPPRVRTANCNEVCFLIVLFFFLPFVLNREICEILVNVCLSTLLHKYCYA